MFKKTLVAVLVGIPLLISSGCKRVNTIYSGKFEGYDIQIRDVTDYDWIKDPIKQKRIVSFRKKNKLFHLVDLKGDGSVDYIYEGIFDSGYDGEKLKEKDILRKTLLKEANKTYREVLEQASKDLFN